jgi:hypothetical protein
MSNLNRNWKVLSWNVRDMNDSRKWSAIRNKVEESACVALCFQETKRATFDLSYLKNFCPIRFSKFAFSPSDGASGGLLTAWNGNLFSGTIIDSNRFALTVKLTSLQSGQEWFLTNIYGPCSAIGKAEFTSWLYNYDASGYDLWMVVDDFNLIRSPENRNWPGGDTNEMLLFNDIIHHLDLIEVPLKDRAFTWSNMQNNCLLEKPDWVFTSSNWTLAFPNTMAYSLSHVISGHVSYVIQMESTVPKSNIFMFENYWVSFPDFLPTVEQLWNMPVHKDNAALIISAKFKALRRGLKAWSRDLSKLNKLINNSSYVLGLIDGLAEQRPLSFVERNFRKQLKIHLLNLLEAKRVYWKRRSTIRWVRFGDENTKLFQSIATQKFRRNYVNQIQSHDGTVAIDHEHKAALLWSSFKDRLGHSECSHMAFDLSSLLHSVDISELDEPFTTQEIDDIVKNMPIDSIGT